MNNKDRISVTPTSVMIMGKMHKLEITGVVEQEFVDLMGGKYYLTATELTEEQAKNVLSDKAANLIEATPLTDEELEKEAFELYPEKFEQYNNGIPHGMYGMCDSNYYERQAHIKARKMGSSGWSDEDMINFHIEVMKQGLADEGEKYNAEDLILIKDVAVKFLTETFKVSPPKTEV